MHDRRSWEFTVLFIPRREPMKTKALMLFLVLMIIPAFICFAGGDKEEPAAAAEEATVEETSTDKFEWPKMLIHMDTSTTAPTYVLSIAWTAVHQQQDGVNWRVLAEASANSKVRMLKDGKAHFWWNTMQSVSELMEGNLEYCTLNGGPSKLRIAHPGFSMMMALTVLGDSGIKTLDDVKPGMKYAVPAATPIIQKYYNAIWRFCDIDPDDMIPVKFGSFPASQSALSEQKVDIGLVDPAGIFAQKIDSGPHGIYYLGFPGEEEDPAAYKRFREVVPTLYFSENHFGVSNSVGLNMIDMRNTGYCLEELDPDIVYNLVKWMDEHYDDFKDTHWAASMMNIFLFRKMTEKAYIPLHRGAIRYLREIGMWTDADDRRQEYNVWLSDWYVEAYQEAIQKAQAEGIEVNPGNQAWKDLWENYKAEIGIPRYRIMSDEEIDEALKEIG